MLNYCGRLIHHPGRDEAALYPQVQGKTNLRLCCRHTNISRHYTHACNVLHLYFKIYSLPLDSDPLRPKGAPESYVLLTHLAFHTWIMGLMTLPGTALGQAGHPREDIHWVSWLCLFFFAHLDLWRWTVDRHGRSWDRVFIIQVSASAVVSLRFSFCVQMSFLSCDIKLRGSGKVSLPKITNTCLEHTWHKTTDDN